MKWGEIQNLLSMLIGLNIAYYSFKEIRAPEVTRFQQNVEHLSRDIKNALADIRAIDEFSLASSDLTSLPYSSDLTNKLLDLTIKMLDVQPYQVLSVRAQVLEINLGRAAMIAGVIGLGLLIASTANYGHGVSASFVYFITALGLAPVGGLIVINYAALAKVSGLRLKYWTIFKEYVDIVEDIPQELVARARVGMKRPSPAIA